MVDMNEKLNTVFTQEQQEKLRKRIPDSIIFDKGASFLRRNKQHLSGYTVEDVQNFVFYGAHIVALFEHIVEKDIAKTQINTAQNPFFRMELNKIRMGLNKIHRSNIYSIDPVFVPEDHSSPKAEVNYPFKTEYIYPILNDILPLMDF